MAGTNLGTAYVTIMPSAKGISGAISKSLGGEATSAGTKAGSMFSKAFKVAGLAVAAVGVKKFFSEALDAGGAMQQSFGGLETIYGDAADGMKEMAYEAAKAGISANSYAEQAVSFGASLKQAYGSDLTAAANAANTAILDMADNSAKMGTDISSIQNAYQGFAKQNYTMLDNLKLGYGGTKKEMERLLKDAEALSGVKYDINNLGDVYGAIHVIQEELGLTGVAAAEAEGTFTGSMGSMKAAWENLKADMALGKDITDDFKIVAQSAQNFLMNNLLPMIGNVLKSIPTLVSEWLTNAFNNLPGLVDSAVEFINNLAQGIADNGDGLMSGIATLANAAIEAFQKTDWAGLGKAVLNLLWTGITIIAPKIWDKMKEIAQKAWNAFKNIDWADVGKKVCTFIGDAIGSLGRLIFDALKSVGDSAKEKFKEVDWAQAGKDAFHMLVDGIVTVASALWDGLKTIASTAAEHFKGIDWAQVGKDILQFIIDGITAAAGFVWEALTTLATNASEFFQGIDWTEAGKNAVQFIIDGIVSLGQNLWNIVKFIGKTAGSTLMTIDWLQLGKDLLNAIKDGIIAVGEFLWGAIQEIGSTAVEWLLDIDWIQAGIDIIMGVVDGIKEFGSAIGDAIVGAATSGWEKFKNFWKIGSPSKLARDTSKWIPIGFAEGIEENADAVTRAIDDMARDVAVEITPVANLSPLNSIRSGVSSFVNNITVNGTEDPETWAARFMREVNLQARMA